VPPTQAEVWDELVRTCSDTVEYIERHKGLESGAVWLAMFEAARFWRPGRGASLGVYARRFALGQAARDVRGRKGSGRHKAHAILTGALRDEAGGFSLREQVAQPEAEREFGPDEIEWLRSNIRSLPRRQREAMWAVHVLGMRSVEVARLYGITESAVWQRCRNGMRMLEHAARGRRRG